MDYLRRQYYLFLACFMLFLCLLCIGITFWAVRSAETVHASQTYEQIFAIKKVFLKDTVRNMIRDIDRIRLANRKGADDHMRHLVTDLKGFYAESPARFADLGLELIRRIEYREILNISFRDRKSGAVVYTTGENGIPDTGRYSEDLPFGNYRLLLGVNEEWVDRQTKADAADIIHSQTFENDGYIWVNEIVNWDGGDNYAIRRIHPNLIATEGSYLSTKMQDVKGNTPYLTELEGVKKSGELYSTYFFKRKGSDETAEKLTYATLYKDYGWIIAMGMYLEDVQLYIDAAQRGSRDVNARVVLLVVILLFLFFMSALYVLVRLEKWFMRSASLAIRKESNTDALTGALNRRMGDVYVYEALKRFHRRIDNPALFSIDLDNFKAVNDTYGHDAGDRVLKAVVDRIRVSMRATDHLFRWGGEEFVLIFYGVDHAGAVALAEKLNRSVAAVPIEIGEPGQPAETIHVTISIGITWFDTSDTGIAHALKRADAAMYRAKADGKNCARFA